MNDIFRVIRFLLLLAFTWSSLVSSSIGQTPTLTKLFTGFNLPTDIICNGVDSGLYIIELDGKIRYIPDLDKDSSIIAGTIPNVLVTNETGLFGATFHPSYPDSNYIFVHYVYDTTVVQSRLSRFNIRKSVLDSLSERVILTYEYDNLSHFGGNPIFDKDGFLLWPVGDGDLNTGLKFNGQDPATFGGAILRLNINVDDFVGDDMKNYGIPSDNPFKDSIGVLDEIYAFGFRNPWRISRDALTGEIYTGDVGWFTYEEINKVESGQNYGWACYEGSYRHVDIPCYDNGEENWTTPIFQGVRSAFRSITGGMVYRGSKFPSWQGNYFFGDFATKKLCIYDEGNVRCWNNSISNVNSNIVTFGQDNQNELYLADIVTGEVFRIDTINVACAPLPDSLHITFVELPIYESSEFISLDTIVNLDLELYSPVVILQDSVQIANGREFKIQDQSECYDLKYGRRY